MSDTNTEKQLTEQELQMYRENMKKFYEQQIPFLKKQKEYEQLLADIEEARAKRLTMSVRIAQIMTGPPEEPSDEEKEEMKKEMEKAAAEEAASSDQDPPKTRNLKKS